MEDFSKVLDEFKISFIEKLSKIYSSTLFDTIQDSIHGVINFNNVALLKKGQKYVKHTDLAFNKCLAKLFAALLGQQKGLNCSMSKDSYGRAVYIKDYQKIIHFFPLEKVSGFPKVPWYKEFVKEITDLTQRQLYVVLIDNNVEGKELIESINKVASSNKSFTTLEDFCVDFFSKDKWILIKKTLVEIESASQKYKWFDLVNVCSDVNFVLFKKEISEEICSFDYSSALLKQKVHISISGFNSMKENFKTNKGFLSLLGNEIYAESFTSSEWLYKNSLADNKLDKTYIVAGYLKSIEQLLWHLIKDYGISPSIGINGGNGQKEVLIDSPDYFNVTIGNMMYYLKSWENKKMYSSAIDNKDISGISIILRKWLSNDRNGYFHKHNIISIEQVKEIREQTLLLYFLLLGSIK